MEKSLNEKYIKYYPFLRRRPLLALRLLKNYFRIYLLGQSIPRKIEFGATFNCQCSCSQCSSHKMKDEKKEPLTLSEIKKIAEDSLNLGIVHANITGGEPLLRKDLGEIIGFFKPDRTVVTLSTNGLLLDREKIIALKGYGIAIIKMSLDSPDRDIHDSNRGIKGCYDKVIESLSIIKEIGGIKGMISTVVTKDNIDSGALWSLLEKAEKYNAFLGLNIPVLSGKWTNEKDQLLRESDKAVINRLVKNRNVIKATHEGYNKTCCPAGNEEFYVTMYGDVLPCPFIQISFGNLHEKNLYDIWNKMSKFPRFAEKSPVCLGGQDKSFIDEYIAPISDEPLFPVSIDLHPAVNKR